MRNVAKSALNPAKILLSKMVRVAHPSDDFATGSVPWFPCDEIRTEREEAEGE